MENKILLTIKNDVDKLKNKNFVYCLMPNILKINKDLFLC